MDNARAENASDEKPQKEKVIMDGDGGSDEMQLAAVLLAHPERVEMLGATCVFGNVKHPQVFKNTRNIMRFLRAENVKVLPGCEEPSDLHDPEKDGAHGHNGLGGVELEESEVPAEKQHSVDFILEQLRNNDDHSVTITASGPLTNIAAAIKKDPETMRKVKQIIIMGGCTHDIPAHDIDYRRGNITYYGEFNFQQAPADAQTVMQSGLPITLLPMNCTQQLSLTAEREEAIKHAYMTKPVIKNAILGMMNGPKTLDLMKFNSAPFMHDIHCALYLLYPERYKTVKGDVTVSPRDNIEGPTSKSGYSDFVENPTNKNSVAVATEIDHPDQLFDIFMSSIQSRIPPQNQQGWGVGRGGKANPPA